MLITFTFNHHNFITQTVLLLADISFTYKYHFINQHTISTDAVVVAVRWTEVTNDSSVHGGLPLDDHPEPGGQQSHVKTWF